MSFAEIVQTECSGVCSDRWSAVLSYAKVVVSADTAKTARVFLVFRTRLLTGRNNMRANDMYPAVRCVRDVADCQQRRREKAAQTGRRNHFEQKIVKFDNKNEKTCQSFLWNQNKRAIFAVNKQR